MKLHDSLPKRIPTLQATNNLRHVNYLFGMGYHFSQEFAHSPLLHRDLDCSVADPDGIMRVFSSLYEPPYHRAVHFSYVMGTACAIGILLLFLS